jgi:hypothetical protein
MRGCGRIIRCVPSEPWWTRFYGHCHRSSTACTPAKANGTAERDTALVMLQQIAGTQRVTVGGDKGFDTADFIAECRHMQVTPHVAQNEGPARGQRH